jgi:hypothetical protein
VATATGDEAQLFGVAPGAALLLLEGATYTAGDRPVEAFKALYRGDKFRFVLESQRLDDGNDSGMPRVSVVLRQSRSVSGLPVSAA